MPAPAYTLSRRRARDRYRRVAAYFPWLSERRRQAAGTLSGGEQQMLAVARALMMEPQLMLHDEPSLGLAPLVVRDIFAILRALNEQDGVTILLAEQNAALALACAGHAYVLRRAGIALLLLRRRSFDFGEVVNDASVGFANVLRHLELMLYDRAPLGDADRRSSTSITTSSERRNVPA